MEDAAWSLKDKITIAKNVITVCNEGLRVKEMEKMQIDFEDIITKWKRKEVEESSNISRII